MSKKQFWARFSLYILFGLVFPFAFLVWRFGLFKVVDKISIGGWGLVAIIFVAVFFIKLIKSVRKGLPFSLFSQCLEGLCKIIIPLLIAAFCVYFLKDLMTETFQFLCVLIICEMFAIVLNPIPQWAHDNKLEESNDNLRNILSTLGIGGEKKDD